MAGPDRRATPSPTGGDAVEAWLSPFAAAARPRTVRARARLAQGRLTLRWVVEGELGDLLLPAAGGPPRRQDGLWQASCFEAFLSLPPLPDYLELNVSPEGHWAAYRFTAPRRGMRHEAGLEALDWGTHRVERCLALRATFALRSAGLEPGGPASPPVLRLGLCAILLRNDGVREFWALRHPGPAPDFHDPAGHVLELALPC